MSLAAATQDSIATFVRARAIAERNKAEAALCAILNGTDDVQLRLAEVRNAAQAARRCVDVEPSAHIIYCAEWAENCLREAKSALSAF